MTTNQLRLREIVEMERHNRATESEENRHNVTTEKYTDEHYVRSDTAALQQAYASSSQAETARGNMAINAINAETQRYAAETNRMSYEENVRHNVATENEARRHNQATESYESEKAAAASKQADAAMVSAASNAAYTAQAVIDMISDNKTARKTQEAQQAYWEASAESARIKAEADRLQAESDAKRKEQQNLIDAFKANLEGLKFKDSTYNQDEGTGIMTWFRKVIS